jgi:predicted acyl esterase
VLFDNGAGQPDHPYFPYDAYEHSWPGFPIAGTRGQTWYLGAKGTMNSRKPAKTTVNQFTWNPRARALNDFSGDTSAGANGLWTDTPNYHWHSDPAGTAVSYLTGPLSANTTVVGAGAVHLWIRASVPNVDLQATITEVRPDGKETFVQNGWLRANERKLDARKSTPLEPVLSLRAKDVSALPRNRFVPVTIPLFYEGHAYRKGSRIRVLISAPNGDQPIWAFTQASPRRTTKVAVEMGRRAASNLVLPVVPSTSVPSPLPPCPSLRGEPCRPYVPYVNRSVSR